MPEHASPSHDDVARGLWDAGGGLSPDGTRMTWDDAVRRCDGPMDMLRDTLAPAVAAVRAQAAHVRDLLSAATRDADARAAEAVEARDDAVATLEAWFARRALVGEATTEAIRAAAAGYVRTSESGGMDPDVARALRAAVDDMCRIGTFADVLVRAVAVPHASERTRQLPPEPPSVHESLALLRAECEATNHGLDPDDARAVAADAIRLEALALLRTASKPFKVLEDEAKVRAVARAVATARSAPAGPEGTRDVMRRLVDAVRSTVPTLGPEPSEDAVPSP